MQGKRWGLKITERVSPIISRYFLQKRNREKLALYEGDAEPLHRLGMKHNEEVASSAFDTIGIALYDLRQRIAEMQQSHLKETIQQSADREIE